MESLAKFVDWAVYNLPPGPAFIPQRVYVNLHKGGMPFYILFLMVYFDNWSMSAWLYLALHGSYGFFWLLKDIVFPDQGFRRPCTIMSFILPWPVAMCPYMMAAYWICSR